MLEPTKTKATNIGAIMKNPNLMQSISDALNAPLGSSKRDKAASILKALNKKPNSASLPLGGQGGNPYPSEQMSRTPTEGMYQDQYVEYIGSKTPTTPTIDQPNLVPEAGAQTAMSTPAVTPEAPRGKYIFPSAPIAKTTDPTIKTTEDTKTVGELYATLSDEERKKWAPAIEKIQAGVTGPKIFEKEEPVVTEPTVTEPAVTEPAVTEPVPIVPEPTPAVTEVARRPSVSDWYETLSEEEKEKWGPLYEAYEAGVGPETFSVQMMADKEKMKKLFPGIPEEALPVGASLSRQVAGLEEQAKEEHKINLMEDNLTNLRNRGLDIEDNLTDYIRSRDKYIERIDNMLEGATEQKLKAATPWAEKRMNNYINYLHILRGRQQKRYTDFLQSGINYHNAELKRAEDTYDTAYKRFQDDLATKTAITTEDFNKMSTTLKEMYNNLDQREERELKKMTDYENYMRVHYDNALKAIELAGGAEKTGWALATDDAKARAEENYMDASDLPADEASAEFWKLSDAEKLKWRTVGEETDVGDISTTKLKQIAWKWLDSDEAKAMSDEEKASIIQNMGLDPENFRIYI